jgi:hypothetical protein
MAGQGHSIPYSLRCSAPISPQAAEAVGISQEELGFLADLHRTAIGHARSDTLLRLCASLGVSAEELFEGLSWTPAQYTRGSSSLPVGGEPEHGEADEDSDAGRLPTPRKRVPGWPPVRLPVRGGLGASWPPDDGDLSHLR